MAEEDDSGTDSWSQAGAPCFPPGARKRRALDLAISQASSVPDSGISEAISAPCLGVSENRSKSTPWGDGGGTTSGRGQWWSTELGAPVEIGVDFVPDTQSGGGDEFIFFPKPSHSGCICVAHDAENARSRKRAQEQVQRMRQLFPPLPSLADEIRKVVASSKTPAQYDRLLAQCGITIPLEATIDHEPESPIRSGYMFKSGRPVSVPTTTSSTPPSPATAEPPCDPSPSKGGMFRSSRSPPSSMAGPSSSSAS